MCRLLSAGAGPKASKTLLHQDTHTHLSITFTTIRLDSSKHALDLDTRWPYPSEKSLFTHMTSKHDLQVNKKEQHKVNCHHADMMSAGCFMGSSTCAHMSAHPYAAISAA